MPSLDKGGTQQACVNRKIREQYYDSSNHPKDDSPVWAEVSYWKNDSMMLKPNTFSSKPTHEKYDLVESQSYPGKPTSQVPVADTWRLDVVKVGPNGEPQKFYDMKFPTDNPEKDTGWKKRKDAYEAIAKKHTGSKDNFVIFDVAKRCACGKKEGQPQTQPQQEPEKSTFDKFKDLFKKTPKEEPFPLNPDGDGKPKPPSSPPAIPLPLPGMPPIQL
jgi:hypothetical protein